MIKNISEKLGYYLGRSLILKNEDKHTADNYQYEFIEYLKEILIDNNSPNFLFRQNNVISLNTQEKNELIDNLWMHTQNVTIESYTISVPEYNYKNKRNVIIKDIVNNAKRDYNIRRDGNNPNDFELANDQIIPFTEPPVTIICANFLTIQDNVIEILNKNKLTNNSFMKAFDRDNHTQ